MTDYYKYPCIALTGGGDGALDAIDGSLLKDGDSAYVDIPATQIHYVYELDADSAAAESSPGVIAPDSNAGDKRWVLMAQPETALRFLQAGTSAVSRSMQSKARDIVHAYDFGVVGDDSTDDTDAINAAYAAAASNDATLILPPKTMKFTSQLVWNKAVNVIGTDRNKTKLKKYGDFIGIKIGHTSSGVGGEQRYENFTIDSAGGADASVGIELWYASYGVFRNLLITNQGSHGIHYRSGFENTFETILCVSNGGDGFKVEGGTGLSSLAANASTFNNIKCLTNGGIGFNIETGDFHFIDGLVSEQNTSHGVRINGLTNRIHLYTESNTGYDILLDASSVRNFVLGLYFVSLAKFSDVGTNNIFLDIGQGYYLRIPSVGPPLQTANSAGKDLIVTGGNAGAGATGRAGGLLYCYGGDAKGTTGDANGGAINLQGGAPVNSGAYGKVILQAAGGKVNITLADFANNAAAVSGGLAVGDLYHITGADTIGVVHA